MTKKQLTEDVEFSAGEIRARMDALIESQEDFHATPLEVYVAVCALKMYLEKNLDMKIEKIEVERYLKN